MENIDIPTTISFQPQGIPSEIEIQLPSFDVICNDHWSDRFLIERELMKLPENYNTMGLPKWIGCPGIEEINKVKACVIEQIGEERWERAMPSEEHPWF